MNRLIVVQDEKGYYRHRFITSSSDGTPGTEFTSALYYVQEEFSDLLIDMMQTGVDFSTAMHRVSRDTEQSDSSGYTNSQLQGKPEFTPSFENGGYRWQLEAIYGGNIIKLKSRNTYISDELGTAVIDDLIAVWMKFIEQEYERSSIDR